MVNQNKPTFPQKKVGENDGYREAAERTVAQLSDKDSRISALSQTPQARNNKKAKMSSQVSTARGL